MYDILYPRKIYMKRAHHVIYEHKGEILDKQFLKNYGLKKMV